MEKTYNGWTNYETWAFNLWLSNEIASYDQVNAYAKQCYEGAKTDETFAREQNAAFALAAMLRADAEQNAPELEPSFYSDMINAAISEINFYEIAESWLTDNGRWSEEANQLNAEQVQP